ncbi:HD domain-containing phosphohydrolase [Mariniplasma anaerobium]|uniref:Diguanylate cyclase n=1 Tax=Mariniplasma anaerobium TaxID=2735436 RepID=A0A7U9TK58_9MOLU|nr:HD domain-containing phosphohydrolase [Mariniplasma anaerobium]BCR35241.1 hypothetical protein MPAN_001340 [Mariniplasma anaerobium]
MKLAKIKSKIFNIIKPIFISKYIGFVIGSILIIIIVFIWAATRLDNLEKLEKNVESNSKIYINKVEERIRYIDFSLSELASNGSPSTISELEAWDTNTEFYIETLTGIKHIVWVDKDLIILRVTPSEDSKYIINETIDSQQNNPNYTNLIIPIYNGNAIVGFIFADVDASELILSVLADFEDNYMVQVFSEDLILVSSDNWEESKLDISTESDISIKNDIFTIILTPTKELISQSTRNSTLILILGIALSIMISTILILGTISNNRLEGLVSEKTLELSQTIAILKHEKDFAQNYLNIAAVMIIILDANGIVKLMNKKGCSIIGVDENTIIGKNWIDHYVPKEARQEIKSFFNTVFAKDEKIIEKYQNKIITANGEERFISWHNSILYDVEGNVEGILSSGEDITEQYKKQKEIEFLSYHDSLTGLYNRPYFLEAFKKLNLLKQYPFGIMMIDVNGLKLLNDAFGHLVGDSALKLIGKILLETIDNKNVIARLGGDEFLILLPNTTSDQLNDIKHELKEKIKKYPINNIVLSLAIGFDEITKAASSLDGALTIAENHMYADKIAEGSSSRHRTISAIWEMLTEKFEVERLHSKLVSKYCKKMGQALDLRNDEIIELEQAGMFHDIGKISIPDSILAKPGKLTSEEYEIMKTHSEIGYKILRAADEYSDLAIHALYHHERWDGKGYPKGIKEEEIPLFSRIIGIVDAYEAMTSVRPYKDKMSVKAATQEIIRCSGSQFDPTLAKVFVEKVLNTKWEE